MPEVVLTALVLVNAIACGVVGRRMKHEDAPYLQGIIAGLLVALIWVPPVPRTLVTGALCILLIWDAGTVAVAVMTAIFVAAGLWLPGGVSVLVLAIVVIAGISAIRSTRAHLRRIARAADLRSGEQVDTEIELTGHARAVGPTVDPVDGQPCALWVLSSRKGSRTSDRVVELRAEHGSAIINPGTVTIQWSAVSRVVPADKVAAVTAATGLDAGEPAMMTLRVLPEGTECYVVGKPEWRIAPPGTTSGMYRDSPLLPTFDTAGAIFTDRSEQQLRRDYLWSILSWSTWSAVCAAIAVVQLTGL